MANPVNLDSAGHRYGAVCAPHFATVEAGRSILAEGGNALEAMLAMAASIAAVYPHMNHLGGDGFWPIRDPSGRVRAILVDGKVPQVGAVLTQEAFAATLEHLTHAGLEDFYRGDVGREMAADLERIHSPLARADLERYRAALAEPLRVTLSWGTLFNTDAPTQGAVSLMILALFARLGAREAESFDHIHDLVEATKRALRMRDRLITDPHYLAHSLDRVLDERYLAGEAMKI